MIIYNREAPPPKKTISCPSFVGEGCAGKRKSQVLTQSNASFLRSLGVYSKNGGKKRPKLVSQVQNSI